MIEYTGDMFDTDAPVLAHGVNCWGTMGAGIAAQFANKYPKMKRGYEIACGEGRLLPGDIYPWFEYSSSRLIINCASQRTPGADAHEDWLSVSLYAAATFARTHNQYRIAIPEIGCGIGGLKIEVLERVIDTIETFVPEVQFELWHYEKS